MLGVGTVKGDLSCTFLKVLWKRKKKKDLAIESETNGLRKS